MISPVYNQHTSIVYHFFQHAAYGLRSQINRHGIDQKNQIEKLGNLGLWTIENLPGKVWRLMKEPRWVTVVLTQIALVGTTYLFYPRELLFYAKKVITYIPIPSREAVKFAVYLTIIAHIVSAAFRAYGRFSNKPLMDAWYNNVQPSERL